MPGEALTQNLITLEPHPSVTNPVITKTFVTGLGTVIYVADPFIVKESDTYYMFFEALLQVGVSVPNVYAYSSDGLSWTYGGETGAGNGSYPCVFKVGSTWYMCPERHLVSGGNVVEILTTSTFPTGWGSAVNIIEAAYQIRDATPFQWQGRWYCILYDTTNECARLFWSDTLLSGWTEHPYSPIYYGKRNTRPAGRPIVYDDYIDFIFQDGVVTYGQYTRVYRITTLTPTLFAAAELSTSPIIGASGSGWNATAMHAIDRFDSTLTVVDGRDAVGVFSIGIYRDAP